MIIRRRFLIPGLGPAGRPCRMLPDFALYKPGAMPQDNLPGKLRTVGPFRSYIFLLHLVELAMHKAVNAPSGGPRRLTDRAFLFGRLLLCQLFPGGFPFFAPLFHAELGCRRLFLLAFCRNFDFGTLCPEVPAALDSCSEPAPKAEPPGSAAPPPGSVCVWDSGRGLFGFRFILHILRSGG